MVGVNFGIQGDNLPSPSDVVSLYKRENIPMIRIFEPSRLVLEALRGSGIRVAIGLKNEDISSISANLNTAIQWVNNNVVPYKNNIEFGWITVGNEAVPGPTAGIIPQAMNNIQSALNWINMTQTKVSTVVNNAVLGTSYPPSAGSFSSETSRPMYGILVWLAGTKNPLFVNVYPYFAYASDPNHISLGYATFKPDAPVIDGDLKYYSLFDAMVDAFNTAIGKLNVSNVNLVVAESGWPTAGNPPYTSPENAQVYNQNLINKVKATGTPMRPTTIMDTFIFAMFNEDLKEGAEIEKNWGIHYPNIQPAYLLNF